MILVLHDQDGDVMAIESTSIMALSIGTLNKPRAAEDDGTVTLIWTVGGPVNRPFMTRRSFTEVLDLWTQAREAAMPNGTPGQQVLAHKGVFPLVAHQYPGGAP